MFYAHFVLAKKGPLSRIWLAAHWDKKLTKAHVFETNLEQSVDGILQPKVKMALRTSGHLLLGVVRIYSRKAKYLLADCNEAFVKIKMAFRPGMVDLPEDNREAAMNAITLPEVFHDFDTEMPDLNTVDIQAQFSMNQTRAEEITMREDYGNIPLDTGDNGFGDTRDIDSRTPEMLRDASTLEPDFGADSLSLAQEEGRDYSIAGDNVSIAAPSSMFTRQSLKDRPSVLDAPIQDDGFGGSLTNGADVLAGGLFEDGSLFEDVAPTMSPSERIAPSESLGAHEGPYPSALSPSSSIGGSRPATPMEDNISPPTSPTPSHHSMASHAPSIAASYRSSASHAPSLAPSHHSTVSHAPSIAPSYQSVRSSRSTVANGDLQLPISSDDRAQETTTLIHNEEESFALAPVDASAIKGFTRAKRKRKLIVDEIKAITGEEMKAQLSDTSDVVTTLDLAPPTKRLMHWKETGGVEKLFALPGSNIHNQAIFAKYQRSLTVKKVQNEKFDGLLGSTEQDLPLEGDRPKQKEFQEPLPPRREARGKKRKSPDYEENEYMRYQADLLRAQEESAKEERQRKEKRLRQETGAAEAPKTGRDAEEEDEAETARLERTGDLLLQTPGAVDTPGALEASRAPSASKSASRSPLQESSYAGSPEFEARSGPGRPPVYPPGTPVHDYTETPLHEYNTPAHNYTPVHEYPDTPARNYETPVHEPSYQEPPFPVPPTALPQADFTDQWVSQAATATATGTAIPPPQTPTHSTWGEDDNHHQDNDEDFDDEEEEEGQGVEEDAEMQEDETIENFEDRVLNKRAAQLHRNLGRRWETDESMIHMTSLLKKNNRKQAAQKFYSLLVLQKVMAVDVNQTAIFGDLSILKGPAFKTAASKL